MRAASPVPAAAAPAGRALAFAATCGAIASVSFAPAIHANFLTAIAGVALLLLARRRSYLRNICMSWTKP